MNVTRRQALALALAAVAPRVAPATAPAAALDPHTHFYDPTRPGGVPWPGKDDAVLYRTALPADFFKLAEPAGISETLVVEASPLLADNAYLLAVAATDKRVRGVVGRLDPRSATFNADLARFARDPLWLGMRLNADQIDTLDAASPVLAALKRLADAGRQLDINAGPDIAARAARIAERVPGLRIVIDHVGNLRIDGREPPAEWRAGVRAAGKRADVYCKVSALVEQTDRGTRPPLDPAFYRPVVGALREAFGPSRLLFASNWPVCERFATLAQVTKLARDLAADWGADAAAGFVRGNALAAYRPPGRG